MGATESTNQIHEQLNHDDLWTSASRLIDRAGSLDALRAHRLQFLALGLWREQGRTIPDSLLDEARTAAMMTVGAPALLKRTRDAYDGDLMLMKGAEVACAYPEPSMRYFRDLDLVADDAPAAQRALIKAGFAEVAASHDFSQDDHLCPLSWPGLPLLVEVHRQPSSPTYLSTLSAEEVLSFAGPSATGIDGLLAPKPAAHAVLLVAHSWTHLPLGRVSDLLDVLAVLPASDRAEADALALRWGWERMWRVTLATADAILDNSAPTIPLRTWASHLTDIREPSVLGSHLSQLLAPAVALKPAQAARGISWSVRHQFGPGPDERWLTKLHRVSRALSNPLQSKSQHDRRLGRNPWSR
ncbi:MAG TPA: nucleotidyltransferase family protein [Solirubrobacteraceae bacterium]|nr:nucleotidyltransferase family protein [Solirubrobacteraceae bacterium]